MLEINPKKFKHIQNKTIPSPLRPKFRNSNQTNIYLMSKRRFEGKKKDFASTFLTKTETDSKEPESSEVEDGSRDASTT